MPEQILATAENRSGRPRLLIWPLAIFAILALMFALALSSGDPSRLPSALIGRPDNRPFLPTVTCPTLVLVGREDALTPVELSQEIAAGIPGARLEIVPGCGHLSTLEQPAAVNLGKGPLRPSRGSS